MTWHGERRRHAEVARKKKHTPIFKIGNNIEDKDDYAIRGRIVGIRGNNYLVSTYDIADRVSTLIMPIKEVERNYVLSKRSFP